MQHWSLCVIYMPSKTALRPQIRHLDSTAIHDTNNIIENVRRWIQAEWLFKYNKLIPSQYTAHKLPAISTPVKQQINGYDC